MQILGQTAEFAKKWRVFSAIYLVESFDEQQNFEQLENGEVGSGFDDFLMKSIAATQTFFFKHFRAAEKSFARAIDVVVDVVEKGYLRALGFDPLFSRCHNRGL